MRVLVIYAHPLADSFAAVLHQSVVARLRASGHEVDDCDLYALGFDPALSAAERASYNTPTPDLTAVAEHVARLQAATASDAPILLRTSANTGHGMGTPLAAQIEEMTAGKGQNLFGIPGKKSAARDEYLVAMAVVGPSEVLTIHSGNSAPMKLKYEELKQFQDQKGQRRRRFSRAYKQIDRLEVSPG